MMQTEKIYHFDKDVEQDIKLTNFYPPEAGFVWSSHTWSELTFDLDSPKGGANVSSPNVVLDIAIDVHVFKVPPDFAGQNVFFHVNGVRLASRFITSRVTVMLEVPAFIVKGQQNVITIDTPDAARPVDHGFDDTRRLGVQIFSVAVSAG
jgi:hypothetical protein